MRETMHVHNSVMTRFPVEYENNDRALREKEEVTNGTTISRGVRQGDVT